MVQKTAHKNQANLFYSSLINILDANDPLIALSDAIDWNRIEKGLDKYYDHSNGRPGKPIQLMAGLLMLKQLEKKDGTLGLNVMPAFFQSLKKRV